MKTLFLSIALAQSFLCFKISRKKLLALTLSLLFSTMSAISSFAQCAIGVSNNTCQATTFAISTIQTFKPTCSGSVKSVVVATISNYVDDLRGSGYYVMARIRSGSGTLLASSTKTDKWYTGATVTFDFTCSYLNLTSGTTYQLEFYESTGTTELALFCKSATSIYADGNVIEDGVASVNRDLTKWQINLDNTVLPPSISPTSAMLTCASSSTTLTANGADSYRWSTGEMTAAISTTSTGTYSVTATSAGGCSSTLTSTVLQDKTTPILTIQAMPVSQSITQGQSASLTVSGASSYLWSTGEPTSTIVVSPSATTTYSVTGLGTNGCSASKSTSLSVTSSPVPKLTEFSPTTQTICSGSEVSFTALVGSITTSYNYTLTNGSTSVTGSLSTSAFNQTLIATGTGTQNFSLIVSTLTGSTTASTPLTVKALPSATINPSNPALTCANPIVTLTASGGSSYQWYDHSTQVSRDITQAGTYSVTVTDGSGCSATAITTVTSSTVLLTTVTSSLSVAPVGQTISLSATGGNTYQWSVSNGSSFTSPTNVSVVTASLQTAGPQVFTVVASQGNCSQTQFLSVTATHGPDLSPILSLPDANFPAGASSRDFVVRIFEVGWVATSRGMVTITLTAPVGYSLSFNDKLNTINVSGGDSNPVPINNGDWQVITNQSDRQVILVMKTGVLLEGGSQSVLGFTLTRTSANSGSVSNITVNVNEDTGHNYDINSTNNIYARILNGL